MILKNDPGYITGSKSGFLSSDKMPLSKRWKSGKFPGRVEPRAIEVDYSCGTPVEKEMPPRGLDAGA
jgi:hypothetical protein